MSKIVVGNWKMNPQSQKEAEILLKKTSFLINKNKNLKIILCLPFPFLLIKNKYKKILIGAQNSSPYFEGSHTGEVSPLMLKNMGINYVIVGHSEIRFQGETNEIINTKIINLLKFKITPILCLGELNRDKEGFYLSFIGEQIKNCLKNIPRSSIKNIVIAYEPIWAIGNQARREATVSEFIEIKIFIRKIISDLYDSKTAHSLLILYGGSVNSLNASSFIKDGEADGLLVGRDSLNPKKFEAILKAIS